MWASWWDMVPLVPSAFCDMWGQALDHCCQGYTSKMWRSDSCRLPLALGLVLCVEFCLKKAPGSFLRVGRGGRGFREGRAAVHKSSSGNYVSFLRLGTLVWE